jgi:hypothetical protein
MDTDTEKDIYADTAHHLMKDTALELPWQTVETVGTITARDNTRLKPGVNESHIRAIWILEIVL